MLNEIAKIVRGLSVDAIEKANSGHPGLPLGCAEIGSVLFSKILQYDPEKPEWPNRDRFVLSAGHGSALLYSLLHLSGYDISIDDLKKFRQLHSKTPGHPEYGLTPGVEATTGPLGQGLANAVGLALAEKMMAEKFNTSEYKIIDHYTYVIAGDGCMMEGISSEAASLAGHWGLGKLIVIYDQNCISLACNTDKIFTESVAERFKAFDWDVIEHIDGHDIESIEKAIEKAKKSEDKPTLIIAKTHIGFGSPTKQDSHEAHGAPLGKEEMEGLKRKIGLPVEQPFYVSQEVKSYFQEKVKHMSANRKQWEEKFEQWAEKYPDKKDEWKKSVNLELPERVDGLSINFEGKLATRSASGEILNKLSDQISYIVGGDADLAPSTKTYLKAFDEVQKNRFSGRNIRFGVREHAMGAICNGIALHKGLRPYCSTFLIFSDYMRPTIRLAAMMHLPIVYIFTHDSIYVGEDGPTHQPVEQLESLRLIPNLKVIRPADGEEVKEAWKIILAKKDGPVALILSRQNLPTISKEYGTNNFARGGYIISDSQRKADVILFGSGSEVSLAFEVKDILNKKNITCRVVSVPDRETFLNQEKKYLEDVLGKQKQMRVVLEASTGQGWYELIPDLSIGCFIREFGKSAPGNIVASQFGFQADQIAKEILTEFKQKDN